MGKKSAQNLLNGIRASKNRGLARLLAALSIWGVGDAMAPLLAQQYPSIGALLAASKEDLARVKGFGPRRAESIYNFFHGTAGEKLVQELREAGVKLTEDPPAAPAGTVLAGKTLVVTGALVNYKRADIEKLIGSLGGKATSSVTKKTDYVVVGEGKDNRSKLDKARELGVPTLTEEEFEKLIGKK
jgi:DNA ligase (NAD+)